MATMPRPRKKSGFMGLCGCFRPNSPDEINIGKFKYTLLVVKLFIVKEPLTQPTSNLQEPHHAAHNVMPSETEGNEFSKGFK